MRNGNRGTILDLWPVVHEDFKKFMSDRPGWFIDALEEAHSIKGERGWRKVKTIIEIFQFLKDTEIEYY